jgi:hypothetical protein
MTRGTRSRDAGHSGLRCAAQPQPVAALAEDDDGLLAWVFGVPSLGFTAGAAATAVSAVAAARCFV